jgi:hypothetical protein
LGWWPEFAPGLVFQWPPGGDAEPEPAAAGDDPAGGGEQPQQVKRWPPTSVNRSCAGCGRSFRTMTRMPSGQEDRSSMPVRSAAVSGPALPVAWPRKGWESLTLPLASETCLLPRTRSRRKRPG